MICTGTERQIAHRGQHGSSMSELELSLAFIAWTQPDPGCAKRRLLHPIDCFLPIHTLMHGLHYCWSFWKHEIPLSLRVRGLVLDTSILTTIFGCVATPLAGDIECRTAIRSLYNLYYGRGGLAAHTDDKYVREQLTLHLALPVSKSKSSVKH
jgi:hypothetical protein